MASRYQFARTGRLVFLAVFGFAGTPGYAQGPISNDIAESQGEVAAIQADLLALVALRDRALAAYDAEAKVASRGDPPRDLTLVLANALPSDAALTLRLQRFTGRWGVAEGESRQRGNAKHPVDPSALTVQKDQLAGSVKFTLLPGKKGPGPAEPVELQVQIEASTSGSGIAGRFSIKAPHGEIEPRQGAISGSAVNMDIDVRPPASDSAAALSQAPLAGRTLDDSYDAAVKMEAATTDVYQQLRAVDLARANGLIYSAALKQAQFVPPVRNARDASQLQFVPDKPGEMVLGWEPVCTPAQPPGGATPENFSTIQKYVAEIRRLAEAALAPAAVRSTWIAAGEKFDDPSFGPWFGAEGLATTPEKRSIIPVDAGGPGPQQWPYIRRWHVLGPFQKTDRSINSSLLPEVVMSPHSRYAPDLGKIATTGKHVAYQGKNIIGWLPIEATAGSGYVQTLAPNYWMAPGRAGIDNSFYYGYAEVFSEQEKTLRLGINVNNHGKLWLNDRLVWVSPAPLNPDTEHSTYVFKVDFQKGVNRLLFRCDNDRGAMYFAVRVCTRGQPQTAAEVAAQERLLATAKTSMPGVLAGVRGWRGDWTGRWPDATPPLAWDYETGTNILWRTTLPSYGHCIPVPVGDRVLVTFEPHYLACLRKSDGKILWMRQANLVELKGAEALQELKSLEEPVWKAWDELQALGPDGRKWTAALVAKGLTEADAKAKIGIVSNFATPADMPWWTCFGKYTGGILRPGWKREYGYTMPTPVTDGQHVWVRFGAGAVACFDLDGNRRWMADTGRWSQDPYSVSSPILIDKTLIVEVPGNIPGKGPKGPANVVDGRGLVIGYDAATGKLKWTQRIRLSSDATGTAAPVRLTNGQEHLDVLVTPDGYVLRADDGRTLMTPVGAPDGWGSPLPIDDVVFFSGQLGIRGAIKLIMLDRDTVGCKVLWYVMDNRPYRQSASYPTYHDGLVYTWEDHAVWIFDLATGANVGRYNATCRRQSWPTPSLIGDKYFFFGGRGGSMQVVEAGRQGKLLALNTWEGGNNGPFFEADRIYMRGWTSVTCVGYTGEAGRKYEAEQLRSAATSTAPAPETAPATNPTAVDISVERSDINK